MKISNPKSFTPKTKETPPLPLVPDADEEYNEERDKMNTVSFKLRTTPADATSALYSFRVMKVDGTQTVRQHLNWVTSVKKVHKGLNMTTYPEIHELNQELLSGEALSSYTVGVDGARTTIHAAMQQAAADAVVRNVNHDNAQHAAALAAAIVAVGIPDVNNVCVDLGYAHMMLAVAPYKALEKQKRYMRRKMRKPNDMRTRTYIAHIHKMNLEELPLLPPMNANQSLPLEEVKDIVIYGLPKSWVRKMDEFDFDPYNGSMGEVINFCERMESAEDHDNTAKTVKHDGHKSAKKPKPSNYRSEDKKNGEKWCDFHETDTHNTKDCVTVKQLKAEHDGGGKRSYNKNKTWKRKSDDASKFSKKELSAIAAKAGKKAVKEAKDKKKSLYLMAMKRKAEDEESSNESDSNSDMDSVASINMMEKGMVEIDRQLADFDFTKTNSKGDDMSQGEVSC